MVDFNGQNKIITLESGVTEIDVRDIYSDWKRWVSESDNSKYQLAFDTIGGDPLTPGITAGAYYFIRNDLGWRIRPFEEDATIYLAGNLTPRDSSFPILTPTTGNYNVLVAGLQPITQSVETLLLAQQSTSYDGKIYVDTYGTFSGESFPYGTASKPVNNFESATILSAVYGFNDFILHGELTLASGADYNHVNVIADSAVSKVLFNNNGVGNSAMIGCQVSGILKTGQDISRFSNSFITDLSNMNSNLNECILDGQLSFEIGTHHLTYCAAGEYPIISLGNHSGVNLIFRNWSGPIEFRDSIYDTNTILMDSFSSHVVFDGTFLKGNVTIYGVGLTENNSTGNFSLNTKLLKSTQIAAIENKVDDLTAISL